VEERIKYEKNQKYCSNSVSFSLFLLFFPFSPHLWILVPGISCILDCPTNDDGDVETLDHVLINLPWAVNQHVINILYMKKRKRKDIEKRENEQEELRNRRIHISFNTKKFFFK